MKLFGVTFKCELLSSIFLWWRLFFRIWQNMIGDLIFLKKKNVLFLSFLWRDRFEFTLDIFVQKVDFVKMLNNTRHHVKAMLNIIHLNKYTKVSLTYSSERLKSLVPHSNPGKTRTVIGIFIIEVYSLFQRSWRSPCTPLSTISVCIVVLVIIIIIFFVTLWNRYYDVWRETGSVLCRSVLWACWGSYRFFDKLLQSCPRNWIKMSPPKQSHGAIRP